MITKEQYLQSLEIVKEYRNQIESEYKKVENDLSDILYEDSLIEHSCLSVRSKNILYSYFADPNEFGYREVRKRLKFKDLKTLSSKEIFGIRNSGKKATSEIITIAKKAGIIIE